MAWMRREEGFTLLELMAALAILGFVVTAIYSFYLAGLKSWQRGLDQIEYRQSARIAMDKMIRELRYACEVKTDKAGVVEFKIRDDDKLTYRFRTEYEQLVFESINKNGTVKSHTKVAFHITELTFSYDDHTGMLHIRISAGRTPETVTLTSSIRPRNITCPENG